MKNIFYAVMIVSVLTLAACSAPPSPSSAAVPVATATVPTDYAGMTNPLGADEAQAGAALFKTNCEMCHGELGHGDGPVSQSLVPPPANLFALNQVAADDYLYWRISAGKPGTSMLGWKGVLTDEQVWQVVSFVRTFK